MIKVELLESASSAIAWGDEMADLWVGTLFEAQINIAIESIMSSIRNDDSDAVEDDISELAQLCNKAEEQYDRLEE